MKKYYIIAVGIVLLAALGSCKKKSTRFEPTVTTTVKHLIREISWTTTGARAELLYNSDSTLKRINYRGTGSSYGVDYLYTGKRIRQIDLGSTLYKFEYFYNHTGQISNIKRKDDGQNSYTQDLEFSYNTNGTVSVLKYYQVNETGKKLIYTNTYVYNTALELSEVTSTAQNGIKFLFKVESHSDAIQFDPLWFIGIDLNENYMIYNYPVLSIMKKLPARIKKSQITNGKSVDEQIVTTSNLIRGGRLEKQNTLINYPNRPGGDLNYETVYSY